MIGLSAQQIEEIESKFGVPVYIFHSDEFVENYKELENTFQKIYPQYQICYSYKTNYTPTICRMVKQLGGYAEVVSDMEYELAKKLGYSAKKIVYNGPCKGKYLEAHLLENGINNVDRVEEAERICRFADENPDKNIKTGIRVNFDLDAGYTSRFGIDLNLLGELLLLFQTHHVTVNGLHCHMSRARGIEPWRLRVKTMLGLVERYHLYELEYISLGSGMFGKMDCELQVQFPCDIPDYTEYGNGVVGQFAEFYKDKEIKPTLFTEPGTTLISKYVDFLAKVEGIKTVRGREFVLLNCSFHNLGETCQMKNLPIRVFHQGGGLTSLTNARLVGYTCLEQDVLYRDFCGELSVGDYIEFGNVGGYSLVDKPPFIQPDCPMIAIKEGKQELIKRAETFEDIFKTFRWEI